MKINENFSVRFVFQMLLRVVPHPSQGNRSQNSTPLRIPMDIVSAHDISTDGCLWNIRISRWSSSKQSSGIFLSFFPPSNKIQTKCTMTKMYMFIFSVRTTFLRYKTGINITIIHKRMEFGNSEITHNRSGRKSKFRSSTQIEKNSQERTFESRQNDRSLDFHRWNEYRFPSLHYFYYLIKKKV